MDISNSDKETLNPNFCEIANIVLVGSSGALEALYGKKLISDNQYKIAQEVLLLGQSVKTIICK
jgi:hypothetical protein